MKRLRGAIIGCGYIAAYHLRGWQRIPEVEIVALADPTRAAAEERRARFAPHAKIHDSMESLLSAERIDFVDILSPPTVHAEQCLRAKAAGLHIICQKPLCDQLEEARSLVTAFADYPKLFCVHENHVYRPWFRRLVALHRNGAFGTIKWVRLEQNDSALPNQRLNLEASCGVLLQYGVHLVDMVRVLLGSPKRVSARLHRTSTKLAGENLAHVAFEYPETTAVIDIAWKDGGFSQGSALVLGDEGEAFYEGPMTRGGATRFRVARGGTTTLDEPRSAIDDYVESFYFFERDFVDAVLNGKPVPQPASENLRTLAMTFAAYAAAEQGSAIAIS